MVARLPFICAALIGRIVTPCSARRWAWSSSRRPAGPPNELLARPRRQDPAMLRRVEEKIGREVHRSRDVVDELARRVANEGEKRFPRRRLTRPLALAIPAEELARPLLGLGEIRI